MAKKTKVKMKRTRRGDKREFRLSDLKDRIWFVITILTSVIYLTWRFLKTLPLEYGLVSIIAGVSLFVVEFLGMFEAVIHFINMFSYEKHDLPEIPLDAYPDVDVFIATYNEPVDLLYKTVNGCKYMDYPDKSKVHIYVCDDGRREEMRQMAERAGVGYLIREDNAHAKAGNLNHALSVTNSPYIVTFDADMIPQHTFLMHTIPYFVRQELDNIEQELEEEDQVHIGFVQTPQAFYNADLFQYFLYSENRIPNEQDYFYRDIQVSRNRSNSVIYGGSNTVISRMALDAVGGFFDKTITEDYGTGIAIERAGFKCIAVSEVMASGLSPTDLHSLIQQRIRWARGVISTNRKQHVFLSRHLTFAQKANYWASEFYWYAPIKRLIYYASPILFGVFGYMVIKCTLPEVLLFWLPMYICNNIALRMFSNNIRTTKWTGIYETVLFPYMIIPVILEFFGLTMKTFKVTKKGDERDAAGQNILYMIPFVLLIVLSIIGIVNCVLMMMRSNSAGPIVVLFWLVYNLYTLIMACFFVMGRSFFRKTERVQTAEDCVLVERENRYETKTIDISEMGVALSMKEPVFISEEPVMLEIHTDRYHANLVAEIVHTDERKTDWKYAFVITDYLDTYEEYMQILYDRIPTLPQKLKDVTGMFGDLSTNTSHRVHKYFYQKRKLPRVTIHTTVRGIDGKKYTMMDFNYEYCTLKCPEKPAEELTLIIDIIYDLEITCQYLHGNEKGDYLYRIENYQEIYENAELHKELENWVLEQHTSYLARLAEQEEHTEKHVTGQIKEHTKEHTKEYPEAKTQQNHTSEVDDGDFDERKYL